MFDARGHFPGTGHAYGHIQVFPVTQDEHEDDAQDEHVEPDIPGTGSAVRVHGDAAVLTVTR